MDFRWVSLVGAEEDIEGKEVEGQMLFGNKDKTKQKIDSPYILMQIMMSLIKF